MKRFTLMAFGLAVLATTPAAAQDVLNFDPNVPTSRVGTRGATFLQIGVGARASALGGAYAAVADDATALYWNTAGIAQLDGFSASFSQATLYDDLDINHTFVGAVLPLGLSRLGVSVNTLSSGDMSWVDAQYPDAGEWGGEPHPLKQDFSWDALAVAGHYARAITDRLRAGAAVKYIQEGISEASAEYIGFDLGILFETGILGTTIGATVQNVGTEGQIRGKELQNVIDTRGSESQVTGAQRILTYQAEGFTAPLPTLFRFSIMTDLIGGPAAVLAPSPNQNLRLVADVNEPIDASLQTALGLEYSFNNLAFLRVGKRWYNEAQIQREFMHGASIGGGIALPMSSLGTVRLDYAYSGMGDLENIQRFGLDVEF